MKREDQTLRVLLVEDDVVDAMALKRALDSTGEAVELVERDDVESSLRVLDAAELDCALVDYRLPDGTALDFLRAASTRARTVPVVVLTGHADDELALAALQQGAQDYLLKADLDGRQVVRAIRYAIERNRTTELERRLNHADRLIAIGQLAAGVAHEVNNPLTFMLGNMELLGENLQELEHATVQIGSWASADAPQASSRIADLIVRRDLPAQLEDSRGLLSECLDGLERIRRIIRDLRVFSRMERDEATEISLSDVLDTASNIVANQVRHRARLIKDYQVEATLIADEGKLAQLFTNLLLNAAQAIEEGAADHNEIRVNTYAREGGLVISIEDTGSGISEENQARLFEPFFTTKNREHGTGLGLTLCDEIVRRHGGEIRVESELGKGTRVEVWLPSDTGLAQAGEERRSLDRESSAVEAAGGRLRVLMIDDEELIGDVYRRLLEPEHQVAVARRGADALSRLESGEEFDVVVCDMMMPEMDGPMVYERIRELRPDLIDRVLFLTGGAFTDRTKAFLARVPNRCLEKPISAVELAQVIARTAAGAEDA